ncbi:MAG: ROK family protein [Opitutae bacterium]|jgi:glucokinase|nr:ROK family protein [Opitutae bacterium]MBT4223873.1 ROK family protein [Opitutae bacterium]MBT5379179.1 ROK family protein [Opitutae bacterium]MBT5691462.1 ROK family protein [Opitutae bacterium]MBT6461953.1 ROK family protein [Opitutae bacterium]
MRSAIGIDLGGTRIKALAYNLDTEEEIKRTMLPTEDGQFFDEDPAWANSIRELILEWETHFGQSVDSIGIASPGLTAKDQRSIAFMPGRLAGIEGLIWEDFLKTSAKVRIANDAHAALLGETWKGTAKGSENVILLTIGTGVGGAAISDGHLLRGHLGRAGHFGHISLNPWGNPDICGTPGSLEDAIGDCTVINRSNGRFTRTKELVDAHLAGDKEASDIWLRSLQSLAAAIVSLINSLDPEIVILGGGIANARETLLDPLHSFLDEMEWRPNSKRIEIRIAELGEWAGATGALHHGMIS